MILRTDVEMLRQGTVQPAAVIHLSAIGVFDEQRNPAYAKALMEFIVSELKIPDTRSVRGRVRVKYSLSSTQVHQVLTHHPCTRVQVQCIILHQVHQTLTHQVQVQLQYTVHHNTCGNFNVKNKMFLETAIHFITPWMYHNNINWKVISFDHGVH